MLHSKAVCLCAGASKHYPPILNYPWVKLVFSYTNRKYALASHPYELRVCFLGVLQVQKAFKRLVTEVEAAKQLRNRAVDALTGTEPKENLSPAHQAVSKVMLHLF